MIHRVGHTVVVKSRQHDTWRATLIPAQKAVTGTQFKTSLQFQSIHSNPKRKATVCTVLRRHHQMCSILPQISQQGLNSLFLSKLSLFLFPLRSEEHTS